MKKKNNSGESDQNKKKLFMFAELYYAVYVLCSKLCSETLT